MKDNFNLKRFLTENKLTSNSKLTNESNIDGIRNAVEGPEADVIFKTAEKYLKDGDAEDMRDALDMAADEYYEFYDRKDNEDGKEVAKYIMLSLPKPKKSNVLKPGSLKNLDKSKWVVSKGTLGRDS